MIRKPVHAEPEPVDVHAERRWHSELEILFDTVRDIASDLSVNEVIERLIDRTANHLDCEVVSVLLLEPDSTLRIIAARGLPKEVIDNTCVRVSEGIAGLVIATGEPLLVSDVESDPRFGRPNHERYYTHSCISVPLTFQGRVRGVINVNNKRNQEDFVQSDLRMVEAIASHAAVALASAHRFEEMQERAQRDALTNLANHGCFWSTLETEVKRAQRHGRDLTLVMADVDHFKAYNDRFGHRQGDAALVSVARVLQGCSRAHDLPARYGGEEFAVILPETQLEGGVLFAEKIRESVENIVRHDAGEDGLTVSIGVSTLVQTDRTANGLVEAADVELYRAKANGRNRVCSKD
jgi:diguanylate cyclase (GGDEF)-like protein